MNSPATSVVCARIEAGDIEIGDRVARRRSQDFLEVVGLRRLVATVRLQFEDGSLDWPRQEASWWRELRSDAGYQPSSDQTLAFEQTAVGQREGPPAS